MSIKDAGVRCLSIFCLYGHCSIECANRYCARMTECH
nr:MAG TPA: hypothetical protein [Caudoviricetes sp.]